jgi:thiamine biosynthesis lipoprotein ApbE
VIGASATECEAWSTALLVLGERPVEMRADLTTAVRAQERDPWKVDGAEAWRISNVQEGVVPV